ncbi:hypothetical protein [Streptomyces scabiei]|uniref:hypothetical protein n=1 Tax=Streptomyces scabiei TaxID=1930 RepID=UPI000A725822|nr:hypothetical protein [Streptomyces scabiei]
MVRTGPSAADVTLLDHLRGKGWPVSLAQLERWRLAGVLPRNERKHLGRGKGSISILNPASTEIAEVMAMTSRRGRSIHEAVLRVFTADPRYDDLFMLPKVRLPEQAIRSALEWFVRFGDQSLDRRIERALKRMKGSPDDAAEKVYQLAIAHYRRVQNYPQPSGKRLPNLWNLNDEREVEHFALLAVARFIGPEEVGPERYANIVANNRIRDGRSTEEIARARAIIESLLINRQISEGFLIEPSPDPMIEQACEYLANVSISHIYATRDKLAFASEAGNLYSYLRGSEIGEPLNTRMRESSTSSIDANMLFHAIIPIAEEVPGEAWHRMTSILIMILTQKRGDFIEESYSDALNRLAHAAAPERFNKAPEIEK